jgi:hypothetical protein
MCGKGGAGDRRPFLAGQAALRQAPIRSSGNA